LDSDPLQFGIYLANKLGIRIDWIDLCTHQEKWQLFD